MQMTAHSPTATATQPLEQLLHQFDALQPIPSAEMHGLWRGQELCWGHPMEGMLQGLGWYGKIFLDDDRVHPLLFFNGARSGLFSVHPGRVPVGLALPGHPLLGALLRLLRPFISTSKPTARLRQVEHRGVVSAAMVYDHLPIIDHFRRLDDQSIMGLMDRRGDTQPYLFTLTRDDESELALPW